MKYLSDYISSAQTAALKTYGAFFAFSPKQFNAHRIEDVPYTSLGAGLICPTKNIGALTDALNTAAQNGIKQDLKENGYYAIIKRELYNHECFYTGDWREADLQGAFTGYGISEREIYAVYSAEC